MFEPERQARVDEIEQLAMSTRHNRPFHLFVSGLVALGFASSLRERARARHGHIGQIYFAQQLDASAVPSDGRSRSSAKYTGQNPVIPL
jgi:hypothetical protein